MWYTHKMRKKTHTWLANVTQKIVAGAELRVALYTWVYKTPENRGTALSAAARMANTFPLWTKKSTVRLHGMHLSTRDMWKPRLSIPSSCRGSEYFGFMFIWFTANLTELCIWMYRTPKNWGTMSSAAARTWRKWPQENSLCCRGECTEYPRTEAL
jgi:hypothetical protein